ncbi:YcxB family protein [Clostridium sp. YIM B02555]|uniref:YcxB family protein n=1 Tax=Clostridium sp. YIM B02555 TaxID=2911968 RepID=UPI001EEF44FA|nr:YcxB family protein [Clostridium sp. YIM B02555]
MVTVRFVNSELDYIEAYRVYYYGTNRSNIDLVIEIIALIMGSILFNVSGFSLAGAILIIAGIIGIIIRIIGYYVLPSIRYRREPKYKEEYLLEFDDEEIRFKTASVESRLEWSIYNKVIETEKLYILVYSRDGFSIIPKRAFLSKSDELKFKNLIDRYILRKK